MKNSTRAHIFRTAAIAVLFLPVAACSPSPDPSPLPTDTPTAAEEQPAIERVPDTADMPAETAEEYIHEAEPAQTDEGYAAGSDAQIDASAEAWEFLGSSLEDDEELAAYLLDNNCYRGTGFNWICPEAGTEFQLDTAHQVNSVFLYPSYQGGTPEGISFDESPEDLVAYLGEPHQTDGSTSFSWWYDGGVVLTVNYPGALEEEMAGGPLPYRMNQIQVHLA